MGRAYFRVTSEMLIKSLHLPEGTKIIDMRSLLFSHKAVSDAGPELEVVVESPLLPDVMEGCRLIEVTPTLREVFCTHSIIEFNGWR